MQCWINFVLSCNSHICISASIICLCLKWTFTQLIVCIGYLWNTIIIVCYWMCFFYQVIKNTCSYWTCVIYIWCFSDNSNFPPLPQPSFNKLVLNKSIFFVYNCSIAKSFHQFSISSIFRKNDDYLLRILLYLLN